MRDTDIERDLREFITKEFLQDLPDKTLANDLPLMESGIIDSLGIFTLIMFVEEAFGVKVEPEEVVLENFETIDAITRMVVERSAA